MMNNDTEKQKLSENLKQFSDEKYYIEAANLTHDEIVKKYGDIPVAIAEIPKNDPVFKGIWNDAESNLVYTGLGSFIDHWVNHHPEMESEDFMKIQSVLENPDKRYYDKSKNAVVFDKSFGKLHDVVILKKAADKLIYERSNYLPEKLPKRWQEISVENGLPIEKLPFVDGHPTISQSDKSEAGIVRNISTLNGNSNISQSNEKSSSENRPSGMLYDRSYVDVDGIAYECKNGVLQGFKDAVTENKELKRENQDLKNEIVELHKQLENNQSKSHKKKHSDNWEYS
jgi:hypothetical protein